MKPAAFMVGFLVSIKTRLHMEMRVLADLFLSYKCSAIMAFAASGVGAGARTCPVMNTGTCYRAVPPFYLLRGKPGPIPGLPVCKGFRSLVCRGGWTG